MRKLEEFLVTMSKYALLLWPESRAWLIGQGLAYGTVVALVLLLNVVLLGIGIIIPGEIFSVVFLLSIILLALTYVPAGVFVAAVKSPTLEHFTRTVRYNAYPAGIRRLAGWLALAGWLGVVQNSWVNPWTVLVGIFLFFMFEAFSSKKRLAEKHVKGNPLVLTMVVVLTMWTAWAHVSPDSHNTFVRYYGSWLGVIKAEQHRGANTNEADAAVSYVRTLRDVNVLYSFEINDQGDVVDSVTVVPKSIAKYSILRLSDHENRVVRLDGQGFSKIKLPNDHGTFVNSKDYWIEADFIEVLSASDKKTDQNVSNPPASTKEAYTLHQGEVWGPEKHFQAGESFTLVVDYDQVENLQTFGKGKEISPGTHQVDVTTPGVPTFKGIKPLAKVTVIY